MDEYVPISGLGGGGRGWIEKGKRRQRKTWGERVRLCYDSGRTVLITEVDAQRYTTPHNMNW